MSASVDLLGRSHQPALRALLAREPAHNMYLLGLLEEFGITPATGRAEFQFYGRSVSGELTAAIFVGSGGALVVPSASPAHAVGELVAGLPSGLKLKSALGDRPAVDSVLQHLAPTATASINRAQRLFSVSADDLGPFTNPNLRLAAEGDLAQLVPMAAHAMTELLGIEPLREDPLGFPARVRQRIKGGRTYVYEERGRIVFKIDVGSRSLSGAELEAPYTLPEERGRGHATLSLGQIARHLLSSLPRLTLRVDDSTPSLAHVARKVGFLAGRAQRLVVLN